LWAAKLQNLETPETFYTINVSIVLTSINVSAFNLFCKIQNIARIKQSKSGECRILDGKGAEGEG
jgi:hypothetical protein